MIKGRQRNNNILIVVPPNCRNSFLLDPLELIFDALVKQNVLREVTFYCF